MEHRRASTLVLAAILIAGCSSTPGGSDSTSPALSWTCIYTVQALGLTQQSSASDARARIDRAIDSADSTKDQRSYLREIRTAIHQLADHELVAATIDQVPCRID